MKYIKFVAATVVLLFLFGCGSAPTVEAPANKDAANNGLALAPTGPRMKPEAVQETQPKVKRLRPPAVVDP